jgi:hypothetical protein
VVCGALHFDSFASLCFMALDFRVRALFRFNKSVLSHIQDDQSCILMDGTLQKMLLGHVILGLWGLRSNLMID